MLLHGLDAQDTQQVMRIDLALGQLVARRYAVALFHLQAAAIGDRIRLDGAVVAGDEQLALFLVFSKRDGAGDFRQHRLTLGDVYKRQG